MKSSKQHHRKRTVAKKHLHDFKKPNTIAIVFIFAVIGVVLLFTTRAASPFASVDPNTSNSTVTAPATVIDDNTASGAKAIQFGTVTPPNGGAFPTAATTGVPAGTVLTNSGSRTITTDGTIINGLNLTGSIVVDAKNVVIKNTKINYTGPGSGGSGAIKILSNASATIDHVEVDGKSAVHACVWHEGASMSVSYLYCHDVEDGVFSWADTGTASSGNNFSLTDSYITKLNAVESNGHWDGFQTEGAVNGVIRHNNFDISDDASGSISIWNGQKSTDNILVENNLVSGGGFSIYAEDYHPSEANPVGGYTMTNVRFLNNKFTTKYSSCVGSYAVWFYRSASSWPYHGGPTGDWGANGNVRSGNTVLETGFNLDNGNPPGCS